MLGLLLGAVAIATGKNEPSLPGQTLSPTMIACIKTAVEKRENTVLSAVTAQQNGVISALNTRKISLLTAWNNATKSEIKKAISAS
jgi:hypothetical protein